MKTVMGRPTKYDEKTMIEVIDKMGGDGESMAELAQSLGIVKDTLYRWIADKPRFSDAITGFKDRSEAWWNKQARDAAVGTNPSANATMMIFNLKNRFPEEWRDRKEVDNTSSDGSMSPAKGPDLSKMSSEALKELRNAYSDED